MVLRLLLVNCQDMQIASMQNNKYVNLSSVNQRWRNKPPYIYENNTNYAFHHKGICCWKLDVLHLNAFMVFVQYMLPHVCTIVYARMCVCDLQVSLCACICLVVCLSVCVYICVHLRCVTNFLWVSFAAWVRCMVRPVLFWDFVFFLLFCCMFVFFFTAVAAAVKTVVTLLRVCYAL